MTASAIARARDVGAAAIVCGGIDDQDLRDVLGHDIGVVAIDRVGATDADVRAGRVVGVDHAVRVVRDAVRPDGRLVGVGRVHVEVVFVEPALLVAVGDEHGVRHGRAEHLLQVAGNGLLREAQDIDRFSRVLAANQVRHQATLVNGEANAT